MKAIYMTYKGLDDKVQLLQKYKYRQDRGWSMK